MSEEAKVEELLGKILKRIEGKEKDDEMEFICEDGSKYKFFHDQGCCESVWIEDICGDLDDLIGEPLHMAEVVSDSDTPPEGEGVELPNAACSEYGSYTWTFYKFATIKGYVTIRWWGESNGYYSEEVSFEKMK